MTVDALYDAARERYWEQARILPDADAAKMLGDYFRRELFPELPDHELFTTRYSLGEIAFLDPEEGERCLDWLRVPQRDFDWVYEVFSERAVSWSEFTDTLAEIVRPWTRARSLGLGAKYDRDLQKQKVNRFSVGTEGRIREEMVYLLAESLVDPGEATNVVTAWWRDNLRSIVPCVLREVLIRLWNREPEQAVAWLESKPSESGLKIGGGVPLFLFSRALSFDDDRTLFFGKRILSSLPTFGDGCFFAAILRLSSRMQYTMSESLLQLVETASEQVQAWDAPKTPRAWVIAAQEALRPYSG